MQPGSFPTTAANSLIQGYCDDFVALAAVLAQTLEQVAMRGIDLGGSRPALERIEHGMQDLGNAIHELLTRGLPAVTTGPAATTPATTAEAPRRQRRRAAGSVGRLEGTSASMPLLSVFQFLGRMRKTGVVEVRSGASRITFRLQNGCIVDSAADPCPLDERLGDLLVEQGVCGARQVLALQGADVSSGDVDLAQKVIAAGANAEDVVATLTEQTSRRYARACRDRYAGYTFVASNEAAPAGTLREPFAIR